jgi:uncharacterized membrane protein
MAEAAQPATHRKRPLGLTFFGLLAIGGLVSMPILAGEPGKQEMPDIVRFIGHFHPVLLHLPIGVFVLILFQELGAIFFRKSRVGASESLFPMFFGAASAIVAVIAGFLLYHGSADEFGGNDLAERHLWGGLIFAVVAVLTFIFKAWSVKAHSNPAWYRLLLFGSVGVMTFASHDGASLTHGSDYLTKYAPEPLRKTLGLAAGKSSTTKAAGNSADPVVYANIVAPILERRCVQCHKEGKAKGKFRMDTYELLVKGGKEGPGIELGKSAESNIIVRMELPVDDDEHMPPEGKPDIEDPEVAIIKWWIDNGADPGKKLAEFQIPADIKDALAKVSSMPAATAGHGADPAAAEKHAGPDEALKKSVADLSKEFPGALTFESQESPLITFTAVSLRGKFDDEGFGKLGPVLPHLTTVDLSATKVTDKSVGALAAAKQLRMVRLSETAVTDSAIETLLKIPTLESINFYGTKVTDAGVSKLSALPNLKRLYLWQTAVTPEAVKALKEKLPKCEIVTGS